MEKGVKLIFKTFRNDVLVELPPKIEENLPYHTFKLHPIVPKLQLDTYKNCEPDEGSL